MNDGNTEEMKYCCISHEFFRVASANPDKIAVIHASSLAQVSKELRENSTSSNFGGDIVKPLDKLVKLIYPPIYSGDSCYTYSNVLKAVHSLSSRLRSILLGWDDPHLVRPKAQGNNDVNSREGKIVQTPECFGMPNAKTVSAPGTEYRPKIVGIYMPPSVEYIVAVLSVLRCGEAFLPLDPFWPARKIQSVLSSSKADLIIKSRTSFGKRNSDLLDESHWAVHSSTCPILNFSMEENLPECTEDLAWPCENDKKRSFCYLMYTSGSTGKPKGVCGTEQGLLNRFFWMQGMYPLEAQDLLLFKSSISFVDHLQEFLSAILTACVLVIPPFCEMKDNAYSLIDFLQAYFINRLIAVPSLMRTILPGLQNHAGMRVRSSLKLLVLSGENFPLTLWEMISTVLPNTLILNLYGSTEVSGDCTYFDCKRMPLILKSEMLSSVPIGMPISNCDVLLFGENDTSNEGELYVGGSCISRGYYTARNVRSDDFVELSQNFACRDSIGSYPKQLYFRTGDLAKKLPSGDFIFLGRKDRIIKVNGNRIALEEIENLLREHADINDAAVICQNNQGELVLLKAFIILKEAERPGELLIPSIRSWMLDNLPSVVVPNHFIFTESFPLTASGKVNYELLVGSTLYTKHVEDKVGRRGCNNLLQLVKKVFCDALMVEELCNDDDFFKMGGNSLTAAHVAHSLGIDMRLLYYYPSPFKLCMALLQKRGSSALHKDLDSCSKFNVDTQNLFSSNLSENADSVLQPMGISDGDGTRSFPLKRMKRDLTTDFITSGGDVPIPWCSSSVFLSCSVSRCNKVLFKDQPGIIDTHQTTWSLKVPRSGRGHLKDSWKIYMESCVDASPMVVFRSSEIYLFIGSHSYKFLCINARSGRSNWKGGLNVLQQLSAIFLRWLLDVTEGKYTFLIFRMETFVGVFKHLERDKGLICHGSFCSGALGGRKFFLDQNCHVKSQPIVDTSRQLIWCGTHDHNLYALDYKKHCCVYKLPCGGSIYGSPAIDELRGSLYVASTGGRVTAISIVDFPFNTLWLHELEVPVFGSLAVATNGTIICCLVDGHVLALDPDGSILWKKTTNGPIFAGACVSSALPSEVLVCSRDGSVYSFGLDKGDLQLQYNVGDPITASAFVDEHLLLKSDSSRHSDRLICICSSSGCVHILKVNLKDVEDTDRPKTSVEEFARLNLEGDIFSSPVMIGGRIFVGCRDDYLHCISLEIPSET